MARLETAAPEDSERVFVIKLFLADDTIGVFEPPQKNSGLVGGKFLERGPICNAETGSRFTAADFFTGARLRLNGFTFAIYQVRACACMRVCVRVCTRLPRWACAHRSAARHRPPPYRACSLSPPPSAQADEFSLSYMEAHPDVFPMSDPQYVLGQIQGALEADGAKLRQLEAAWVRGDMGGEFGGFVDYASFQAGLSEAGFELNEQPLITLMRHFHIAHQSVEAVDYKALLRAISA
jgi:hypothetical protein